LFSELLGTFMLVLVAAGRPGRPPVRARQLSSAKSDFPDQTNAIDSAVSNLQTGIKALSSSPTPAQLASVAVDIKNTVSSVSAFASASKDKCQ
jgi:hypothetical protein